MNILPVGFNNNLNNNRAKNNMCFKANSMYAKAAEKLISDTNVTDDLAKVIIGSIKGILASKGVKVENIINSKIEKDVTERLKKQDEKMGSIIESKINFKDFRKHGMIAQIDEQDGLYTIDRLNPKEKEDIEFVEKHFNQIKQINDDADFSKLAVTDLGNIEYIGGSANFQDSKITNLGKLYEVGYSIFLGNSKIKSLGNIEYIGGTGYFTHSNIRDLGKLKYIKDADFTSFQIDDLGELEEIGGNAIFTGAKLKSLGKLKRIGGNVSFCDAEIGDLGNLKEVGGTIYTHDNPPVEKLLRERGLRFNPSILPKD